MVVLMYGLYFMVSIEVGHWLCLSLVLFTPSAWWLNKCPRSHVSISSPLCHKAAIFD
jgi:hypothetical protein